MRSGGNCRGVRQYGYCTEHQRPCPKHPGVFSLIGEECPKCRGRREAREREERQRREDERDRRDRAKKAAEPKQGRKSGRDQYAEFQDRERRGAKRADEGSRGYDRTGGSSRYY